ncbi:MAG: FIST signal transduction protein [Thiobacillus sp.]
MNTRTMHYLPEIDARCLDELLVEWQTVHPRMGVLVLLPEAERDAVELVQQACVRRQVPVVGALFPALIEGGAFRTAGAWLLRFDEMPYAALFNDLPREPEQIPAAMDMIAAELLPHLNDSLDTTLCLLFDAMVPNVASLLDELYLRLANRVHYMGACAGSETFQPMPCLFDGTRTVQGGVLAILMKPHSGAILEHGYSAPPQMLMATSTEGNRIVHIDWRPAFEVYQALARAHYGVEIDRDNFYRYGVHFPFGIVRANGMILVRIPVGLAEDGSLFCIGEVPPNALLTLLKAPAVDSAHTLDALAQGLSALDGPQAGRELLLFYCAGRRLHLGIRAAENELSAFAQRTQAAQVAGALSLGEIGGSTKWGYPLFHNATLVASRWEGDSA